MGFGQHIFHRKKMRLDEGSILEKAFWRMIFATRDIKEVVKFLRTFFMMVANSNDYITGYKEFREEFRGIMEGQFGHDLGNKSFINQVECYENDTLDKKSKFGF